MIIQQVTKGGTFVGSNKLKHMVSSMAHMRMSDEGRYLHFSKNRRGGNANKIFFSVSGGDGRVEWMHEEPMNQIV